MALIKERTLGLGSLKQNLKILLKAVVFKHEGEEKGLKESRKGTGSS